MGTRESGGEGGIEVNETVGVDGGGGGGEIEWE